MDAVVEIDEIGNIVDSSPLNRLPGSPTFADRLQIGTIRPYLRVTIHTGLGWRDSGVSKLFNSRVAVTAVDAVIANVMFVAELDRLNSRKRRLSVVRRAIKLEQHPDADPDKKHCAENGGLRYEVCASIEDLTHCRLSN